MADIFLSYSTRDTERVRPIVAALERQGWSVWWDRKVPPGMTWRQMIEQSLQSTKCVLVVWSVESIQSRWVVEEAEEGHSMGIMLPCMIDNIAPPLGFRSIQAARLMEWQGDSSHPEFMALIESIQAKIEISIIEEPSAPVVTQPRPPKHEPKKPVQKAKVETTREPFTESLPGGVKLDMVSIPGGSFMMGSKTFEDSQPIHKVTLKPFYIGKYQVTQKQWEAVMGKNPSNWKGDDLPVETVSWDDVKEFCKKLSEKTGREYRLPSEAEWEYAARAGSTGDYCFGNDESLLAEYAWFSENSGGKTHPVGQKKPNAWGLYDVHGNVWEWCEDFYYDTYKGAPDDGSAWVEGGSGWRLLRGGSWYNIHGSARAVSRDGNFPGSRDYYFGFRVVGVVRPPSL